MSQRDMAGVGEGGVGLLEASMTRERKKCRPLFVQGTEHLAGQMKEASHQTSASSSKIFKRHKILFFSAV